MLPRVQEKHHWKLQKLSSSILEAYKVGATIEDLDIFDLKNSLLKSDNQDIKLVYDLLSMGSRNHMRTFYGQIIVSIR